ncbi:hypothetical protein BUALT_Bualt05G0161400 [Buddleja alternifolia]|uniref:non-specific serine/threonine protein kinase n=1 Tax=Buddleja alternifolia TaxID=168488 RepID=A0AAV6XJL0_9LAMI|nr:hypothetical protein BUALT_Bualt05G0161400 [Buddleja alternifolia]
MTMKIRAILLPSITIITLVILQLPDSLFADPRTQTVNFNCATVLEYNRTAFVPNFVATMENISDQIRSSGFGIARTGSGPDSNYGLAQCYGDLSSVDCVLCYAQARTIIPQCYPWNGGRIYLDGCFMRSENYSFFEEFNGPNDHAICGNITRNDSAFQESARQAIAQAVLAAPNNTGYARARVAVPQSANSPAYVLANCWRTLSNSSCRACLENASASILGCLPASEGRALKTGCFMRYSDTDFLNPIPGNGNPRGRVIVIIIAAASAAAVFIIGAVIGIYFWKNKTIEKKRKGNAKKLVKTLHDSSLNFKYSTLEKATGSFDEANKLGHGGFGTVYKGVLPDGREIAVKRLFFNNKHRAADFYNEVNIISSVEHKNLVRLLGCSCSGPESLLVYEFLPNKSLDRFIFDSNKGKALNWERRFEIIIGTAEGLVYLHENTKVRIIHRDIKASNILLDSRLRARIADFGLARSFQDDKSHISTAIAGTFKTAEYMDSLVAIAWNHFQQKTVEDLFDPNLMLHNYHNIDVKNEISRVVHIGLLCTQEIPSLRPSMSKALEMLVKKEQLPAPTSPPFMDENTMELNDSSENILSSLEHGSSSSVANISHSIFYPRKIEKTEQICIMERAILVPSITIITTLVVLLLPDALFADPRSQTLEFRCGTLLEHNRTIFVPNFVAAMENISDQIRTSGFGIAMAGSGPDANYGFAQCYGDLSPLDCVFCHAQARTIIPQCYPYTTGRIYLDGCFMRAGNYSFFHEYNGPNDRAICGNITRNDSAFRESTRRAIAQAVLAAPNHGGYARAHVSVPRAANNSAYVLANCWRTLDTSSCRACLENASASILGCLPSSEGRALKTGCFMRYSDTDFLNPIPRNGSRIGRVIVIIIAVASAAAVCIVGAGIGVYIWKHKSIEKKRKVEDLFDPNLMLHNYHNIDFKNEISRVVHIGLLCTQEIPSLRPSMSKALEMLVKKEQLPAPTSPPFMDENTMELNDSFENPLVSLEHGSSASVANISHSIFYPR